MGKKILFRYYKFSDGRALKLFGVTVWSHARWDGYWWFRVCGKGIHGKDITRHPLLFSERNGYVKRIQICKWSIKWLS